MLRRLLPILLFVFSATLANAQTLKVGVSPDYPPLAYLQEGQVVGIEADNARAVSEIIRQQMKMVPMPFKELIPALQAGKIDVIMSGMSVTDERAKLVTFSDAYMRMGQMAIMHKDKVSRFAQPWAVYREGVRIGIEPGTTGAAFAETELKDAELVYYTDAAAAFQGLRKDEIDLYVHDAPTSWQLATSSENSDLISLYSPLTDETLAWAVRKGDDALAGELNRALGLMKSNGTLRYILNRHIPVTVEVR
jgi:polar amino acid transport system substrate-binding protein